MSFWVPFLLLYLGGPDSITAFALEDNELSLRHFVEIVFSFIKCFGRIKALLVNLTSAILNQALRNAFRVVEIELGFSFDMLYTEANVVYIFNGFLLRLTSISVLIMIIDVGNQDDSDIDICRTKSKHISDYLMYLLVTYPVMLPIETGLVPEKAEACSKLLEVDSPELFPCKSALFDSCRGFHHEQQLTKGAEILTHVWLLIARLGITEQFQVSQGHARVL
ncbi:hypothetical protein Tco_0901061 [Tanacetum coccineum]